MAIVKGNHTVYTSTSTSNVVQITFDHNNDGEGVFVAVNEPLNGAGQTVTAKYGGVPMTLVGRTNSGAAAYKDIWVFKIPSAALGVNTVEVNFSLSLTKAARPIMAVSMSGLTTSMVASSKFKASASATSISDTLTISGTKPVLGFCVSRYPISDAGAQTYLDGGNGGVYASIAGSYDGEVSSSANHAWSFTENYSSMAIVALDVAIDAPTVTTQAVSNIDAETATLNGNITATGGESATTRGFYYKEGAIGDPTASDSIVSETGTFIAGAYSLEASGLKPNTSYRVAAFATNSAGTGVGSTVTMTTTPAKASSRGFGLIKLRIGRL